MGGGGRGRGKWRQERCIRTGNREGRTGGERMSKEGEEDWWEGAGQKGGGGGGAGMEERRVESDTVFLHTVLAQLHTDNT